MEDNRKTVVLAVIFPALEAYLDDFFESLCAQTYKEFDLVIVNDGIADAYMYEDKYPDLSFHFLDSFGTPSKNREHGIKFVNDIGYEKVIFCDVDDYFAANRFETVVGLLEGNDIVVNEVDLVDADGASIEKGYISKRCSDEMPITLDFLREKNICGLSNSAARTDLMKDIEFHDDIISHDWYLFTTLISRGAKAVFTDRTVTFYRQHRENTIGLKKISVDSILTGIKVKAAHYRELSGISSFYADLSEKFNRITRIVEKDPVLKNKYIEDTQKIVIEQPLWWENIRPLEERDEDQINR